MIIKKFIPVVALTAITTLAPTTNADAHWCGGWRFWVPFGIGVGVPLAAATTRAVYGPPYYRGYYRAYPYYYRRGYSMPASVQASLARQGFYHGAIDGIIGPQSREAIRGYQVSHRLPVTGEIDRPLLRSLRLG